VGGRQIGTVSEIRKAVAALHGLAGGRHPRTRQAPVGTIRRETVKHGHHIHIGKSKHIFVAVVTTSGTWPAHGYENIPTHQPVKDELHRAAHKLGITDTTNWVAKVDGRELDVNKDYPQNGLHKKVYIDYGPREGGGGNE
jgi:hypothetical protein